MKKSKEEIVLIADGGYDGQDNVALAKEKNVKLVTTALVGKQLRQTKKWCRNGPFQYQKKLPFRKTTTRKTTWKVFLWK